MPDHLLQQGEEGVALALGEAPGHAAFARDELFQDLRVDAPARFGDVADLLRVQALALVERDYNALNCDYIEPSRREPPIAQPPVSIRELKSRLSHYLRLTRKGESVVITDHGVPIGRIVPMGQDPTGQDLGARLAAMRDTGLAQWSGRKLGRRKPVARLSGGKTVAQLLVDDRE